MVDDGLHKTQVPTLTQSGNNLLMKLNWNRWIISSSYNNIYYTNLKHAFEEERTHDDLHSTGIPTLTQSGKQP
jgi:hypothetical protein